jgi:2',3'-cyclic-nucleotide 2'-phosphodiesterase (5'-nucleotidase family)
MIKRAFIISWLLLSLAVFCRGENRQHLVILHTNDIHGHLAQEEAWWLNPNFPPPVGNAAAAATIIREEKESAASQGYGLLLLEGGDIFQGTPVGEFTRGQAVVEYMNLMGYDAMTIGNHDYDKGTEVLRPLIDLARFPVLGANIVDSVSRQTVDYLQQFTVVERGGIKIGIFGITTHYMRGMATPEHIKGLDFTKESATAQKMVDTLKALGVDIIIALSHAGFRHDKAIADTVAGIDVIVGAHSHTGLRQAYEDPAHHTIIVQTFGNLSTIGRLELSIDPVSKKIMGYTSKLQELSTEEVHKDTTVTALIEKWRAAAEAGFDSVIGYAQEDIGRGGDGDKESTMGNLICDAMIEATGADFAFQNTSGIKGDFVKGEVTYRDVYKVDAFGNYIVTMDMTGTQVLKICETSVLGYHAIFQVGGMKMKFDAKKPAWQRVVSVTVRGEPIDTAKIYKIATNNFLGAGGGNYKIFQEGKNRNDTYVELRQALADFIKKHSPLEYRLEGRVAEISGGRLLK